jgi:signal transduction histidine kinase/Tfp pilus assembly protein PilF
MVLDCVGNFLACRESCFFCGRADVGALDLPPPSPRPIDELILEIFNTISFTIGYRMRIFENYFCLIRAHFLKLLLTALLLPFSLMGYAQSKIDSLEAELAKELPDTSRVSTLLDLSEAYEYVDVTKSKEYTREALDIAEKKSLGKYKVLAYQSTGSIFRVGGDFQSALDADTKALENSVLLKDSSRIATSYNNVAHDYFDLGDYDEAYHYFLQSYSIASGIGDSLTMAISLHNIGRVFKELGQYEKALDYLNSSRKLSEKISDYEGEPYSLSEIGDVMLRQGKDDSALTTLQQTLRESRKLNLKVLEPRTMINMAQILLKKQEFDRALAYYDTAFALYQKTNDKFGIAEVKLGKGLAYTNMGRLDDATASVESSVAEAKKLNARILELKCFQQLSALWERKGDFKKALYYFKQFEQVEDTLFSQDMQSKMLQDQIRFETESKDFQIAVLNQQQEAQKSEIKKQEFVRNILVVVMALSGILLVTVYRSGQRRRKINMLLLQHQDEMEKRSEELEKLNQVKDKFFSIISHDLRSPINALSGLLDLLDKGALTAEELPVHIRELRTRFHHTRTLLNNLLDWTLLQMDKLNLQATKIDISKLVDENIQLLGAVQGKDIKIINEVPRPSIAFADSNTINLVIRNLITNAIKFTNDGGSVVIKGEEQPYEWLVSVQDNGIGMRPEVLKILFDKTAPYTTRGTANEKGTGLGLILCKEFVEKNGGKIWVESEEGKGSTFYFTLPKGRSI